MKYLDRFVKFTDGNILWIGLFFGAFASAVWTDTWLWRVILCAVCAAIIAFMVYPLRSERNLTDGRELSSYPSPDPQTRVFRDWDFRLDPDLAEARKDREGYGPKFIAALLRIGAIDNAGKT